jgi:hypothetical protein
MSLEHSPGREGEDAPVSAQIPLTMSVPEAGKMFFNLSRNGSYAAALRGDIITVRVGRLRRVPVEAQKRKLERDAAAAIPA